MVASPVKAWSSEPDCTSGGGLRGEPRGPKLKDPRFLQACLNSRQHRSICGLERWSVHLSSKRRHLVAQHGDLDVVLDKVNHVLMTGA
jgi:hypothetical protein